LITISKTIPQATFAKFQDIPYKKEMNPFSRMKVEKVVDVYAKKKQHAQRVNQFHIERTIV
jgi:hypothetical protein